MQQLVSEAGLQDDIQVDSVGTGSWHVGDTAHPGTRRILAEHGIQYVGRARQIGRSDIDNDTWFICMDDSNLHEVEQRYGSLPHLYRLLDFAPQVDVREVPDPYFTGDFESVYQLVLAGCEGLIATIRSENGL